MKESRERPPVIDHHALYHLGGHLAVLHRRVQRADETTLLPYDVSSAEARALRAMARQNRPLPMSELAKILDVVPRSVTSLIDELEPMGFVRRTTDPEDLRRVCVSLTKTGRAIVPKLTAAHGRAVATVLAPLSPHEIEVLDELLRRVAHTLTDE